MNPDPAATTLLCFGDSNTHGTPGDDPDYARLPPDARWTGRLQRLLGDGWSVIEEGLGGRTIDRDVPERPGLNGRAYLVPCLLSHAPLDAVVLMLGSNDLKVELGRTAEDIAARWDGFLDDLFAHAWTRAGRPPAVLLVSPIHLDPDQPRYGVDVVSFDEVSVRESRRLAGAYRDAARRRGLAFLDAAEVARAGGDGLHLDAESHEPLARTIADAVRSALGSALGSGRGAGDG